MCSTSRAEPGRKGASGRETRGILSQSPTFCMRRVDVLAMIGEACSRTSSTRSESLAVSVAPSRVISPTEIAANPRIAPREFGAGAGGAAGGRGAAGYIGQPAMPPTANIHIRLTSSLRGHGIRQGKASPRGIHPS